MFRREMPRVYELRDLIQDPSKPSAYFQNFDNSLRDEPCKKQTWLAREHEFQRLDADSWQRLKDEARPYLSARDARGRGWEQLISILNQARAHNYLVDQGCSGVSFIRRSKRQKQQTPDIKAQLDGQTVLCEVKTINISEDEVNKRRTGSAGSTTNLLNEAFFKKLESALREAKRQMDSYYRQNEVRRIAFVAVNFDDWLGEYKAEYFSQIDQYLASNPVFGLEIVFYNQKTPFHAHVSMLHAYVVNELDS